MLTLILTPKVKGKLGSQMNIRQEILQTKKKKKTTLTELKFWGPSPVFDSNLPPVSVCWWVMIL